MPERQGVVRTLPAQARRGRDGRALASSLQYGPALGANSSGLEPDWNNKTGDPVDPGDTLAVVAGAAVLHAREGKAEGEVQLYRGGRGEG